MSMKTPKLSRKQIKEALDQLPIERILVGSNSKAKTLTNSQIKFAEEMALGRTKAEAYRRSRPNGRKSNAKPATASRRGAELASDSRIQAQIDAFKLAMEAQKYTTPLHLRALVIQRLTEKAIDPEVKDSQQLKALELIGKLTEVGSFTERREIVNISDSNTMKEKLIQSLRLALSNQDVEDVSDADEILAEIIGEPVSKTDPEEHGNHSDPDPVANSDRDDDIDDEEDGDGLVEFEKSLTHSAPTPKIEPLPVADSLHSIPLNRSANQTNSDVTITDVRVTIPSESMTCVSTSENPNMETPPVSVSNGKG